VLVTVRIFRRIEPPTEKWAKPGKYYGKYGQIIIYPFRHTISVKRKRYLASPEGSIQRDDSQKIRKSVVIYMGNTKRGCDK
jgi:hypothetical protein